MQCGHPVDHHLTVRDVHPRCDHHRVADRHLSEDDRESVEHVGQQRHPPRPKGGAGPVADEGPEGVGDQGEADGLDGPVEPRPVFEAVASPGRRDPGVGEDGFDDARTYGLALAEQRRSLPLSDRQRAHYADAVGQFRKGSDGGAPAGQKTLRQASGIGSTSRSKWVQLSL